MICVLVDFLAAAHNRGVYNVACDQEASAHYGIPLDTLKHKVWQVRCYVQGFLHL